MELEKCDFPVPLLKWPLSKENIRDTKKATLEFQGTLLCESDISHTGTLAVLVNGMQRWDVGGTQIKLQQQKASKSQLPDMKYEGHCSPCGHRCHILSKRYSEEP